MCAALNREKQGSIPCGGIWEYDREAEGTRLLIWTGKPASWVQILLLP